MTHHVVVVGGGFGGLPACPFPRSRRGRRGDAGRPTEPPSLPTAAVPGRDRHAPARADRATAPTRAARAFANVSVELARGRPASISNAASCTRSGAGRRTGRAPVRHPDRRRGRGQSYFGHDEFALYAPGMKTIDDAWSCGAGSSARSSSPRRPTTPDERREWLTIVVVGAGPTGVELAGQIRELARPEPARASSDVRPDVRAGGARRRRQGATRCLRRSAVGAAAVRQLEDLGVELRMGARVTDVDARGVDVETNDGTERIAARTVVWAAGRPGVPARRLLADATGARDRPRRADRGAARPHAPRPPRGLRGRRHGHATTTSPVSRRSRCRAGCTPRTRSSAASDGDDEVRCRIATGISGAWPRSDGSARSAASVGIRLSGLPAWIVWLFVHLAFLNGFGSRFATRSADGRRR